MGNIAVTACQKALKKLWTDRCTVTVRQERQNPINKQTEFVDVIVLADEPCRVSFERIPATSPDNGTAIVSQAVKLFLRSDLDFPPGSTIAVTRQGRTETYVSSGQPAIYPGHQEIALKLKEERA